MNPDTVNNADRCLSDAAKHRLAEETSDTIDAVGAEHTRKIAEALIEQLTKEEDHNSLDARNAERISKLRDTSKLFEPVRERVANRRKTGSPEPAKKLLKELLQQGNAQLSAVEKAPGADDQETCDAAKGCEVKLTREQVKTIVLQSATTSVDLEAQKANPAIQNAAETASEPNPGQTQRKLAAASMRISRTDLPSGKATGAPVQPKRNILSFIFSPRNTDKQCDAKGS
jgi:hypothetical protein